MRKLFTFAVAVLAAITMSAQEFTFTGSTLPEGWVGTSTGSTSFSGESDKVLKVSANGTLTYTFSEAVEITSIDFTFSFGSKDAGKAVDLVALDATGGELGSAQLVQAEKQSGSNIKQNANVAFAYSGVKTFKITNSSDKNFLLGYIKFNTGSTAPSTDPVEAAEISGENACLIGGSVELTCTAAKATTYQWSMNGAAIDGATAKKYTFTPTAAGEYSFTCAASNEYNTNPVVADAFVVTVTDPAAACGELIKATHVNKNTATVTGVVGGSADKNTQDNGKLGSNGNYFGVKLAAGKFQAGDVVTIVASALNGGNVATIYSDKGTTLLASADFDAETLTATYTLEEEAEWIYVYRASSACNPSIASIAVNRSCEASNNADIKKVWVMAGEEEMVFEPEEDGITYNLVVPASVEMTELSVNYKLAHPKATANVASPFVITVPAAGAAANSQVVIVTAQDGTTQKTYTFNVTKSAAASTDASLKSLAVTGYTLDPAFAADVFTYTITKAYGAENPGTDKVVCEPNDATAHPSVAAGENALVVTVTAEDGKTQLVYTINIVQAAAPKDLAQVKFSNGFDAFIDNANLTVKAFYLAGTEAPTATNITAGNGTAGELADGKIIVTGADDSKAEYTVTLEAVTPNTNVVADTAEAGAFDGTEAWVKNGLLLYGNAAGFSEGKYTIRRQLKSSDKADDQRVIAGWVRTYFFVGNASKIELTITGNKKIKYAVDGGEQIEAEVGDLSINLAEGNHMIEIVSNQASGDCYLSAPKLVERETEPGTAIDNTNAELKAVKVIENGQIYIIKNGVKYNAQGAVVR